MADAPARYPSLDVWRGAACLSVLVYHATLLADPSVLTPIGLALRHGVTLFFVISGYCITATVVSAVRDGRGWRDYTRRRLRRILPPYWAAAALTAAAVLVGTALGIGALFTTPVENAGPISAITVHLNVWQWIGNVSLIETWRPLVVWRGGPGWLLGTAWTLCYEEQFYAVMGIILAVAQTRRTIYLGAVLVTVAVLALAPYRGALAGLFVDGRWLLFAVGVATFYGLVEGRRSLVLAGFAIAAAAAAWLPIPYARDLGVALGAGTAFVLLRPFDAAVLRLSAARWAGERCYSIYLVHWPIAKVVGGALARVSTAPAFTWGVALPVCLGLSLAAAGGFFALVERRFLAKPTASQARESVVSTFRRDQPRSSSSA